ncbi:glyoxysomal processing protease, glyoxysomal-like [Magnolia sinica]|uniref:glyoxysomal processing protease, glyoxysomal-like n=1 Tax=Magnolia sinica TaxID=86752 RepID=UPI00265A8CB1|nr:glyoxysomal processing protease, glyoxysomal-like [Magnolia sinica]
MGSVLSISVGAVSKYCPPGSHESSLLMSDIRCLPMNATLLFTCFIIILNSDHSAGFSFLVVTWNAISTAWRNEQQKVQRRTRRNQDGYDIKKAGSYNNTDFHRFLNYYTQELPKTHCSPPFPFEKAMPFYCSCRVLNNQGLIPTSAHTLQQLRFPTKRPLSGMDVTTFPTISICELERSDDKNRRQWSSPSLVETMNGCVGDVIEKRYERLYVRLDHTEPPLWCYATAVYVSKGPLDVALLQLESFPNQLRPITPHFGCPSPGSKTFVTGHCLFGPTSGLYPFVYSGVVARVVEEAYSSGVPVMLETTVASHPGSSGGAVVNSDGHMIGLATGRLGTIPFLDFSIPSEALRLIFDFSRGIGDLSILQQAMDKPNEFLSSVWGLKQQPSSQRLGPFPYLPKSLVEKINEGKGSRFVNFLAKKRAETFPGEPPPSMDKPIKEEFLTKILPSNL